MNLCSVLCIPHQFQLIPTVFIKFFLLFFVQDQCLHVLLQAPDLLFHHLTLHTVNDIHIKINSFFLHVPVSNNCLSEPHILFVYGLEWHVDYVILCIPFNNRLLPLCILQNLLQLPQPLHCIQYLDNIFWFP